MTITVTADRNCNLKALKRLQREGYIDITVVAIEGHEHTRGQLKRTLPTAIIDSRFALIDQCAIADDDTPYKALESIIGKENHGDVLQLEKHIHLGNDVFVTDDNDFLSKRQELGESFGVKILTCSELVSELMKANEK